MQQLVGIGRNEPCPCGSGQKFKKCCLDAHTAAVAGRAAELDVVALVDDAIKTYDWDVVHPHVDRALELFTRGAPLEHIRFRDDLVSSRHPDLAELAKLCTTGWLNRCDLEMARVLGRYALKPDARDALRVAVHLLRRFGARSPIVEELAKLQVDERITRARRMANALSTSGLTTSDSVSSGIVELGEWMRHVRPPILTFADWFALRTVPDELLAAVWSSGVSSRVVDFCLDRLDDPAIADRRAWALLAGIARLGIGPVLGEVLAMNTPLRTPTADEHAVYEALHSGHAIRPRDIMFKIIEATELRRDFAGAALLRETMRMLQHGRRRP